MAPPLGVYSTPILYTAAATAIAGSFVYLLRNGVARTLGITEIVLDVGFQATTAAATSSDVEIVTLTGVTADALGTLYPPARRRTSYPASGITSCRSNGVVTATGGVVERTIGRVGKARSNGSTSRFDLKPDEYGRIQIEPGTGNALALRLNAAAVIGDTIRGWVTWQET